MTEDESMDESARDSEADRGTATSEPPPPPRRRRRKWIWVVAAVFLAPFVVLALWTAIALSFSYSEGERAGYVQKISKKGWLCKTMGSMSRKHPSG